MPGALERLPGRLQQQPLLRVHRQRLARRDAEEARRRTRPRRAGTRPARGAAGARVGSYRRRSQPRSAGNSVIASTPVGHQPPQVLRRGTPPGIPAAMPTITIGSSRPPTPATGPRCRRSSSAPSSSPSRYSASTVGGRVVEDQRGGQPQPGGRARAGCAVPRAVSESKPRSRNARPASTASAPRRGRARRRPRRARGRPAPSARSAAGSASWPARAPGCWRRCRCAAAAAAGADQAAQQRRHRARRRAGAARSDDDAAGRPAARRRPMRGVEQGEALLDGQRRHRRARHPAPASASVRPAAMPAPAPTAPQASDMAGSPAPRRCAASASRKALAAA